MEGLTLYFVRGSRYLGAYLGPQKALEAWFKPQVEAWAHWFRVLGIIARQHPQSACASLRMLLQLERQYLQRNVPGVGTLMGSIKEALREKCFPRYLGGGDQRQLSENRRPLC